MREGIRALRRIGYFVLQAVLIPIFTLLEASAVVYSLISPERRFHVVHKPTHHADRPSWDRIASEPSWYKP